MIRAHITIDTVISGNVTDPQQIAQILVTRAEAAAKQGHKTHRPVSACFAHRNLVCAVFTTPSGQLRYQVGPMGKPTRNPASMLGAVYAAERDAQAAIIRQAATVPMKAEVCYIEGQAPTIDLKGTRLLHRKGTYRYFHVGAVARGQRGRKEYGGPLVEGPWAYAFEKATVLSDSAAFRERDAAERDAAIVVDDGSRIWVDGVQYTVTFGPYGHIALEAVDTSN